jgi:UV excision repair protein RAD23
VTPATPANEASGAALAIATERNAQIAEMESMGFERSQIEAALRAAYFNSERAIEYLLTVSQIGQCCEHSLTYL